MEGIQGTSAVYLGDCQGEVPFPRLHDLSIVLYDCFLMLMCQRVLRLFLANWENVGSLAVAGNRYTHSSVFIPAVYFRKF